MATKTQELLWNVINAFGVTLIKNKSHFSSEIINLIKWNGSTQWVAFRSSDWCNH